MKLIRIFLQIEKDILEGNFNLPALPAIAFKVRKAVKDPMMDLNKLASVVSLDPSFTAYLINLANSPLYRGVGRIETVPLALSRMGMQSTRTSALVFAIRSLFSTQDRLTKKLLSHVWKRACRVSALAFVIADNLKSVDPERASIAGLLHNVGMIPVIIKLVEQGENEQEILKYWQKITIFSKKIGVRAISTWGLKDDLRQVAAGIMEWEQNHDEPLVDLVNLAIWHSYLGTTEFKKMPSLDRLAYFKKNPMLSLDKGESLLFVKESQQEIKQMMQSLNG